MNPAGWPRIKPVLDRVLFLAPDARGPALDELCGSDAELRREVDEYLRYEQRAAALLSPTAWREEAETPEDAEPPARVGSYRIVRELARGGMGTVYLAERDDGEYRQAVAIKIARPGPHPATLSKLLRYERQILARLKHPNIAALMDGGTTTDGRPYFVMEYVDGQPLVERCKQRGSRTHDKLKLFLGVCEAVAHAHRMLLIHGDLKPANILVTETGVPKLLDFGISRISGEKLPAALADPVLPLLTPRYASPEQRRGDPLTTAADIYSLGVILFELLAGALPPSASTPVDHLGDPDLDSIIKKAVATDPEQRYLSVEALQADLDRYLRGYPVLARDGGALYRVRLFTRRNLWGVSAAVVACAGVVVAFAVIWTLGHQARMRFDQLRQFARSIVFDVYAEVEQLPGSTKARTMLVERTLSYLNSLEAASAGDPTLTWELAEAYTRIADAQGNNTGPNLGNTSGALENYNRARALLMSIVAASPGDARALRSLATVEQDVAVVLQVQGKTEAARTKYYESARLLKTAARYSTTLEARKALALARWNLAVAATSAKDWPTATLLWNQTLSSYQELAALLSADLTAMRNVALCHKRLAAVLTQDHDLAGAERHYRDAERIDSLRVAAEPANNLAKADLGYDLSDLGLTLANLDRPGEAQEKLARALALRRQLAAADKNDFRARAAVARTLKRMAELSVMAGDRHQGVAQLTEAVSILGQLRSRDSNNKEIEHDYEDATAQLAPLTRSSAR